MVPWTPLRFGTAPLLLPLGPRSVASVTKSDFLRLLRLFAANPLPPAERPAHLADLPSVLRPRSSAVRRPDSAPKAVTPPSDRSAPPPSGARAHPARSPQSALPSAAPLGPWSEIAPEDSNGRSNRSIDLSGGGGSGRPVMSGALGGRSGRISRGPVTRARASIRLGGGARTSVASRAFSECRPGRFSKAARASLPAEWAYLIRRRRDARKTRGRRLAFVKWRGTPKLG